jgi:zinc protease
MEATVIHHRPWATLLAAAATVSVMAVPPVWAASPAPAAATAVTMPAVREFTLPNGLKVLLVENHAAPVVTWMVSYKVGSRNEPTGMTGSAHLLEHMLFKGTKDLKKGQIARLLTRYGASFNATTSEDVTRYFETYSADKLELGLRIEASRMRGALILDKERQPEMSVVRSELEIGENDPNNLLYQAVQASAFMAHPYHHPVIGWRSDVETVKTEQLREFYNRYYQPNNAVAVLVGDFEPQKAEALIRQHFGSIPQGAPPPVVQTQEEPQRGERRVVIKRQGERNLVQIAYHLPAGQEMALAKADVLASWLSQPVVGPLYQDLVEAELALSSSAYLDRRRDASLFWVVAEAKPGVSVQQVEKALLGVVDKLSSQAVPADALQRSKVQAEADSVFRNEGTFGQAAFLTEWEILGGDWKQGYRYQQALQAVTAGELQQFAQSTLHADNRTVGHYISDAKASPISPRASAAANGGHQADAHTPLPDWKIGNGKATFNPLRYERIELPNGMTVLVAENHNNPTATVNGYLRLNAPYTTPKDRMVGAICGEMLDRGTAKRSKDQLAKDIQGLGADLSIGGGFEKASFGGRSLSRDVATLIDSSAEMMRQPSFSETEFLKVKQQLIASTKAHQDDPRSKAAIAYSAQLFPPGDYRRWLSADEEIAGLQAVTLADVKAFHRTYYTPQRGTVVVVGDVKPEAVKAMVSRAFGDWQGRDPGKLEIGTLPMRPQARQVVAMPDKSNVVLCVGNVCGLTTKSPDFAAAMVMNRILGGDTMTARLGRQIRDVEGLTYGIYSSVQAGAYPGFFQVNLNVNPSNVDAALSSVQRELRHFVTKGITDDELTAAKQAITGLLPVRLATNGGVASALTTLVDQDLPADWYQQYPKAVMQVTKADVARVSRDLIDPEKLITVIAGPYTETLGKTDK